MQADFQYSPGETVILKLTGEKGIVCGCFSDGTTNEYLVRTAGKDGEFSRKYFAAFEIGAIQPDAD